MLRRSFLTGALALTAASCESSDGQAAPPEVAAAPRPGLSSGHHAEHVSQVEVTAAPEEVWRWFEEGRLMGALETQGPVARPVSVEPLALAWPQQGALRRARLEDGNYVLEEVLESQAPQRFLYQVWTFTSPAAAQVAYGVGEFEIDPLPSGGVRLTWRYRLRAKALWAEFFVDRFVKERFGPFMDNGLRRLAGG